ncbi:MAG: type IV secretion system DNA-binding domain-containing protein [Proteobacteria bacterium]|nr:type IV secretion system DNA-binding domain-containing protein [Pseudomonadota bacterium]
MSSLTHGASGLVLGYAAVAVPMAVTVFRRTADYAKAMASAAVAVPLTLAAGITNAVLGPVIHGLGIASGSVLASAVGAGVCVAIGYGAARAISRPPKPTSIHQRGTLIHSASAASEEPSRPRGAITLAGLSIAALDETKHFKIIGTTGTGKSTAIRELLTGALDRGDRAIIADPDGGYLQRFKNPSRGDLVLNPFENQSRKWDLFGEIDNPYDIDQLARSLLPDQGGPDRSWISYARTFFSSVTRQAHEAGVTDLRELYRLLVVADAKELRGLLAGTPAQPFLEEHNGRMFDSIRSVTSSAVGSLDYIAQQSAEPLSIRQWVRNDEKAGGVLFIPYKAGQIAALRSTISAWMRLAIFEAMSQPEGDQRLWFVVDELDALGQIDGLKDALARLRKFGGRTILGFQSIAQVSSTYGTGDAQTLVENCGNTLILRCSGSDHGGTANFASRLIGQREVLRTNRSRSRRPGDLLSSTTLSEHVGIEPAVMDSQIEQLPDLTGYLKFASVAHWQQVTLVAPDPAGDGARARETAKTAWQHWRANHTPPDAQSTRETRAAGSAHANDGSRGQGSSDLTRE